MACPIALPPFHSRHSPRADGDEAAQARGLGQVRRHVPKQVQRLYRRPPRRRHGGWLGVLLLEFRQEGVTE